MPRYILQPAEKTKCPDCKGMTELLCTAAGDNPSRWFYICWNCKNAFQIGKGKVERV